MKKKKQLVDIVLRLEIIVILLTTITYGIIKNRKSFSYKVNDDVFSFRHFNGFLDFGWNLRINGESDWNYYFQDWYEPWWDKKLIKLSTDILFEDNNIVVYSIRRSPRYYNGNFIVFSIDGEKFYLWKNYSDEEMEKLKIENNKKYNALTILYNYIDAQTLLDYNQSQDYLDEYYQQEKYNEK